MEQIEKFSRKASKENFVNYLNILLTFKTFLHSKRLCWTHFTRKKNKKKKKLKQDTKNLDIVQQATKRKNWHEKKTRKWTKRRPDQALVRLDHKALKTFILKKISSFKSLIKWWWWNPAKLYKLKAKLYKLKAPNERERKRNKGQGPKSRQASSPNKAGHRNWL
jgi:hypothetical protein